VNGRGGDKDKWNEWTPPQPENKINIHKRMKGEIQWPASLARKYRKTSRKKRGEVPEKLKRRQRRRPKDGQQKARDSDCPAFRKRA
jgi:hypothetical protein